MAKTKYKRKPSSSPKKSSVVQLDPERIRESQNDRWQQELYDFLSSLSEIEFEVAQKLTNLMARRPAKDKEPCEVIQFVKEI